LSKYKILKGENKVEINLNDGRGEKEDRRLNKGDRRTEREVGSLKSDVGCQVLGCREAGRMKRQKEGR